MNKTNPYKRPRHHFQPKTLNQYCSSNSFLPNVKLPTHLEFLTISLSSERPFHIGTTPSQGETFFLTMSISLVTLPLYGCFE